MKILADENIDKEVVDRLRADGHDVLYITEEEPGIDDQAVLDRSLQGDRVLLLVRLAGVRSEMKAKLVATTFDQHGQELGSGFAVLSPRSLRFRKSIQ